MISHEQSLLYLLTSNYHPNHHQNHQQSNQQTSYYPHTTNRIPFVMLIVSMGFLIIFSELQLAHSNPVPSTKGSGLGPNGPDSKVSPDDLRRECYPGSDLRDLCEMCAKVTRNVNTFPWCCTRQLNVTQWCEDYLSYSIGPNK